MKFENEVLVIRLTFIFAAILMFTMGAAASSCEKKARGADVKAGISDNTERMASALERIARATEDIDRRLAFNH